MPIYRVGGDGSLIGWPGGGDDTTPPAAPTGVTAEPLNGGAQVSWTPNTETDVDVYRVRMSFFGTLLATVQHPTSTATVTGLNNGSHYTLVVEAVDTSGNVSAQSAGASVTPSAAMETIFGYNVNAGKGAPLSSRLIKWSNRAPMVRLYNDNFLSSGTFGFDTNDCPEMRLCYSVKADGSGSFTKAGLAAGNGNARLTAWCESIPAGWEVILVYYHEPNDNFRDGSLSVANYQDAYAQFRTAIDAANLKSGVKVQLACNFMAYRIAETPTFFDDSWVPPVRVVNGSGQTVSGVCDLMTIDIYGNPGSFTNQVLAPNCSFAEGGEYGASFPNIQTRFRDSLEAIVRNGYKDKWGVLEHNTPPRDFDGPTNPNYVCGTNKVLRYQGGRTATGHDATHTEVERAAWLKGCVDYCLSNPTILGERISDPYVWLFWETPQGAKWNQKWYDDNIWNALAPYVVGSR